MLKRIVITFILVTSLITNIAIAGSGALFNVSATGESAKVNITLCLNGKGAISCQNYNVSALNLSVSTTVPNHTYPAVGIKINTPGYSLANLGLDCAPSDSGYCLFSVSNLLPANISISKFGGYSIGGTIANLTTSGLVLQNNGSDNLIINSNETLFQFPTPVVSGGNYNVTVFQQPTGLRCIVNNGSGTNVTANITNIAIICSSNLFVTNLFSSTVGKYTPDGTTVNAALITGLDFPYSLAVGPNGHLYVVNITTGVIGEYTTAGETVDAALITGLNNPTSIAFKANGNLYVANGGDDVVGEYTAAGVAVNPTLITGINEPTGLAIAPNGNIYVRYRSTIGVYTPAGVAVNSSLITGLGDGGLAFGPNGNLYVTNANAVSEYTADGAAVNVPLITGLTSAFNLAFGPNGNLYVALINLNTIGEYTTAGGTVNAALITGLNGPAGIAFG